MTKKNEQNPLDDKTTYKFEHVPVKDIVVGEALSVEEVPEELAEVRVVGLVIEPQRAAEVQVGGKLRCRDEEDGKVQTHRAHTAASWQILEQRQSKHTDFHPNIESAVC